MDRFGWFFSLTHFATNTSSTTQPHKIPANNLRNAIFTMLFLHGFCPVFQHAERDTYSRLCWSKFSIRLVGTVKLVCFLCKFWWWKMQFEYGCVWIVFFSSLTSPPTPAAPHNRTKCQQTTCAMQFSPCLFLRGFCPVFQHAERDTCSRLCWPKFSIRSVGTVKFVCFLCEFWWWKVQL